MSSTAPPDEVRRRLPHEPKLWAANFLRHPNDPSRKYDFRTDDGDSYLYYLTDDARGPMNPENWGNINVLLFARGSLKTWTTTTILGWGLDCFSIEALATAPVDDQRTEVIDRFKEKAQNSGLAARRVKDNIGHQKFQQKAIDQDTGEEYTTYSHLKSRSAWNDGDKLRGIHAHIGVIDESQDIDEGAFSTVLEAVDRSIPQVDYFPTMFVIGTPKMANTFFHKLWRMSDQKSWDREEGEWIVQDESQEFLPQEMREEKEEIQERIERLKADEGDHGDLIDDLEDQLAEMEGFTVKGWHVDQHNCPLHSDMDIAYKKETYSPVKFANEVEAEFYSPENDLLSNDDVFEWMFDDDLRFSPNPLDTDGQVVMGVDWGGGDGEGAAKTVAIVAQQRPDDTLQVLDVDVFDSALSHAQERQRIHEKMNQYGVDTAVVDEGYGDTDREELQDEYGHDNLYGCWFGRVKDKEEIKWNRHKDQKRFFTCDKTYMVKSFVEDAKDENVTIPSADLSFDQRDSLGTQIVDNLTAPYTERVEHEGGQKKIRVKSDRSDDIFDAFTLTWMAANKVGSQRTLKKFGGHTMKGI